MIDKQVIKVRISTKKTSEERKFFYNKGPSTKYRI